MIWEKIWAKILVPRSLGSMGPLTKRDVRLGFHQLQILVIWGPYRHPDIVACQGHAKTPKLIPWLCVLKNTKKNKKKVNDVLNKSKAAKGHFLLLNSHPILITVIILVHCIVIWLNNKWPLLFRSKFYRLFTYLWTNSTTY